MFLDSERKLFTCDYSTLAVACDRKLHWSRYRSLTPKVEKESTYFGKALHKFLEAFWLGNDWPDCLLAFERYVKQPNSPIDLDPTSQLLRSYVRGVEICAMYFRKYDPDRKKIKIHRINGQPLTEVSFAFVLGKDDEGWTYIHTGRIDRIELREDKYFWIVDSKSTTRFGPKYWQNLRPNDQITGYSAGVRELLGIKASFYALDVLAFGKPRTSIPKELKGAPQQEIDDYKANIRLEQGPTSRSDEDISEWWANALHEACRIRKLFMSPHIQDWTKRTSQCSAYGGCDFRDLCKVTTNWEPIINTLYSVKPWSPFDIEEEGKEDSSDA